MDSDRIAGTARAAAGAAEAEYGRLLDDPEIEAAGAARQAAGQTQDLFGQAKDGLRDQADKASAYAEEIYDKGRRAAEQTARAVNGRIEANPVGAIVIAVAVGYLIGLLAGSSRR